jgi:hypothetical protein
MARYNIFLLSATSGFNMAYLIHILIEKWPAKKYQDQLHFNHQGAKTFYYLMSDPDRSKQC